MCTDTVHACAQVHVVLDLNFYGHEVSVDTDRMTVIFMRPYDESVSCIAIALCVILLNASYSISAAAQLGWA